MNNFCFVPPKDMTKSERPKALKHEDGVDLISNLPDPILLLILSGLHYTEEVIRTSILSSRWRYLWTSIPSLRLLYSQWQRPECFRRKNKFKEFVYWVFLNRSVDLDSFRLNCSNFYNMSTVRRWIHGAVKWNVKQLDLSFRPKDISKYVKMPHCVVTCASLEVLKLDLLRCRLILPNFTGFPALKALELNHVELFGDELVKSFLQNCPLLEDLTLLNCLTNNLNLLCISCPKLKKLKFVNQIRVPFENEDLYGGLKISCPKLDFIQFTGERTHLFFFESLDSLKEAMIEPEELPSTPELMGHTIGLWFAGISSLESLLIDFYFFIQCINAARDPTLPNLKILVLKCTMSAFTVDDFIRILTYYPKLESLNLIIEEEFDEPQYEYEKLSEAETKRILSHDLKRVEFLEFIGEMPKVDIEWYENTSLDMFYSWGNKASCLAFMKKWSD